MRGESDDTITWSFKCWKTHIIFIKCSNNRLIVFVLMHLRAWIYGALNWIQRERMRFLYFQVFCFCLTLLLKHLRCYQRSQFLNRRTNVLFSSWCINQRSFYNLSMASFCQLRLLAQGKRILLSLSCSAATVVHISNG